MNNQAPVYLSDEDERVAIDRVYNLPADQMAELPDEEQRKLFAAFRKIRRGQLKQEVVELKCQRKLDLAHSRRVKESLQGVHGVIGYISYAPPVSYIAALAHAYNGDREQFLINSAKAKTEFAELLDMMMDEANVSTHYRGSSVDVARAGEGSMLDHADQLKAWHTSLDDTEKFADICAMWTAGTADVVPDYRE